jgi:acyl dehydratase
MNNKLLTEQALAQIGTVTRERTGLVTANDIGRFCSGILEESPEHFDAAAARALGYRDIIAPPTFAYLTTRPCPPRSAYLADGQYGFVAPPGLQHLQTMLGGQSWEFHRPAVIGDVLEERRTVLSMEEREGKTGPMAIVRSEQAFVTPEGEPVETLVSTLILRTPPPPIESAAKAEPATLDDAAPLPEAGPDQLVVRTDMIQSFLFNAAIWAVHRIHWDVPFARSEGLPSTVLVGWNLANFVARLGRRLAPAGQRLHRLDLSYRAIAHPGDVLTVTAGDTGADGQRPVTMTNNRGTTNVIGSMGWI